MICHPTFGKTAYMPHSRIVFQFKSTKEISMLLETASKMIKGYQRKFFIKKRNLRNQNKELLTRTANQGIC